MHAHIQHELDTIERTRQQQKYSSRRSSTHLTNGNPKVCFSSIIDNRLFIRRSFYEHNNHCF